MLVSGRVVSGRVVRGVGTTLVIGLLALTGLTACGGGSSDGDASSSATAAASDKVSTETSAKAGASSSSDLSNQLADSFNAAAKGDCTKAQAMSDSVNPDSSTATFDVGNFESLANAMKDAAAKGPAEIRADLKTMSEAFATMVAVYKKLGIADLTQMAKVATDPTKAAELQAAVQTMQSSQVAAASDRLDAWMKKKCPGLGGATG